MGWDAPRYAHLPVIMKLDNGNRRKLSKRKDNEAAISYFLKDGYPTEAIIEYLFTIANSNYEEWHTENKNLGIDDFNFTFNKMSLDGALFDLAKLQNIAKEVLASYSKEKMYEETLKYGKLHDENIVKVLESDPEFFKEYINIEREKENPRKDYMKYSEILAKNAFFYKDNYDKLLEEVELPFNPNFSKDVIKEVLSDFASTLDYDVDEQTWFSSLKALGLRHNFAESGKIYKQNKDLYIGQVGDVAEMVRIAMTTSKQSPNLYYVLRVLKKEEITRRINKVIDLLK